MKKEEVPQDDANLLEGKFKVLQYAVDRDGHYTQVGSVGWEPQNTALSQAWDMVNEQMAAAAKLVKDGKQSPILYFMRKNMMDIPLLSRHTHIAKWRIRRHLKPAIFRKLKKKILARYADAFNISIDTLINFKG